MLLLALVVAALLMVRRIARLRLSQLGFRPWRLWTTTEKSYFLQVLVIANVAFPLALASRPDHRAAEGFALGAWSLFLPYLVFGFYQELVYRGMVQLALARRWGAPISIVVANVLYTFGPLHAYYFLSPASRAAPMLAAIFAIGLFFGALYQRSGNLWIVAVFHAVGNAYMVWGSS